MAPKLDPTKAGAAAILNDQLAQWGIKGLGPDVIRLLQQGLDPAALMIELQNTNAYKQRFAGNEAREKAGLRVLPPAEYVATETSLKGVLRSFGLPAGFYDSNTDMQKFIENDVSPSELQERANIAQQVWLTGPQENRDAWNKYYGHLGVGGAIAAILDPKKAVGLIQKQAQAAAIGGTALTQGLAVDRTRAEQLAAAGVTQAQATQGYGDIAGALGNDSAIAQRFGQTLNQGTEEDARLLGLASAQRKIKDLQAAESGLFAGRGAANSGALSGTASGAY